jgi:NAD+ synthase (glutamine-hydrolysing)
LRYIVFPELCLTGYPPEDLLLRPSLALRIEGCFGESSRHSRYCLSARLSQNVHGQLFNMAGAWLNGECLTEYAKQKLPNYQVFDERRYFEAHSVPLRLIIKIPHCLKYL